MRFVMVVMGALALSACNCGGDGRRPDAGHDDAGVDASVALDAGVDAGANDAGMEMDAGVEDAGVEDAGHTVLEAAIIDAQGDVWVLWLDGGAQRLAGWEDAGALGGFRSPRWQPRGMLLAVADGRWPWLIDGDGGVRRLDADTSGRAPYQGDTSRVEWSPDGTRLAFDGLEYETDSPGVFLLAADGGAPELVGVGEQWAWETNQSMLFSQFDRARQAYVTYRFDLATRDAGEAFEGMLLDSSGATGASVVQQQQPLADGGTVDVVSLRSLDGATTPLFAPGSVQVASWRDGLTFSPAGDEVAIRGTQYDAQMGMTFKVLRARLDGGMVTLYDRLFVDRDDPEYPSCLRFVPGGEWLSYRLDPPMESLHLSDRDGGTRQLATPPLTWAGELGCLDWRERQE